MKKKKKKKKKKIKTFSPLFIYFFEHLEYLLMSFYVIFLHVGIIFIIVIRTVISFSFFFLLLFFNFDL